MTRTPREAVAQYIDGFNTGDAEVMAATFDVGGEPVTQTGAAFTAALRQRPDGWCIAAWAWTKGKQ